MTLPRYYKKRPKGQIHDSNQERDFASRYPQYQHHPPAHIEYIIETFYLPDFLLGVDKQTGFNTYLELKELFTPSDVAKYKAVVRCNSRMILVIIAKSIYERDLDRLNNDTSGRLFAYRSYAVLPWEWQHRVQQITPKDGSHDD